MELGCGDLFVFKMRRLPKETSHADAGLDAKGNKELLQNSQKAVKRRLRKIAVVVRKRL